MNTHKIHGRFLQIPYIKISCLPNSNLRAMLDSFGVELDKILHNTVPVCENEVKRQKSISKLPQEVGEGLYTATRGVIDHLIKIYMYMQIDYLERNPKPEITKEYVFEIAE